MSTSRHRASVATMAILGAAATAAILPAAVANAQAQACPASVTVPAKTSQRFYPPLAAGDREFEGHGPAITVAAKRQLWQGTTDTLRVVVRMRAEETAADWTTAERTEQQPPPSYTLYQAPDGCRIVAGYLV